MHFRSACLFTVLATTGVLASSTCNTDKVLHSLKILSEETALMPAAVQAGDSSLDPEGVISQGYQSVLDHLDQDLKCDIDIPDRGDQQRVCDAYIEYTKNQKLFLESNLSEDFVKKNSQQPEAGIIHRNIMKLRSAVLDYTFKIGGAVPECPQSINDSYLVLDDEIETALKKFPEN